jgi:hypothetical protein
MALHALQEKGGGVLAGDRWRMPLTMRLAMHTTTPCVLLVLL